MPPRAARILLALRSGGKSVLKTREQRGARMKENSHFKSGRALLFLLRLHILTEHRVRARRQRGWPCFCVAVTDRVGRAVVKTSAQDHLQARCRVRCRDC